MGREEPRLRSSARRSLHVGSFEVHRLTGRGLDECAGVRAVAAAERRREDLATARHRDAVNGSTVAPPVSPHGTLKVPFCVIRSLSRTARLLWFAVGAVAAFWLLLLLVGVLTS